MRITIIEWNPFTKDKNVTSGPENYIFVIRRGRQDPEADNTPGDGFFHRRAAGCIIPPRGE